jgi:hypothetical protein
MDHDLSGTTQDLDRRLFGSLRLLRKRSISLPDERGSIVAIANASGTVTDVNAYAVRQLTTVTEKKTKRPIALNAGNAPYRRAEVRIRAINQIGRTMAPPIRR